MIQWRREIESKFRYNASRGVPPADQVRIKVKYLQLRHGLQKRLTNGKGELVEITNAAKSYVARNETKNLILKTAFLQAKADYDFAK